MIHLPHPDNGPQTDESTLRAKDYATVLIGVEWPDDMKVIELTKDEVLAILDGQDLVSKGKDSPMMGCLTRTPGPSSEAD